MAIQDRILGHVVPHNDQRKMVSVTVSTDFYTPWNQQACVGARKRQNCMNRHGIIQDTAMRISSTHIPLNTPQCCMLSMCGQQIEGPINNCASGGCHKDKHVRCAQFKQGQHTHLGLHLGGWCVRMNA